MANTLKQNNVEDTATDLKPVSHDTDQPTGFLDESQIAILLRVSRGTVFNYRRDGLIPYVKLNRRVLYDWDLVRESLRRRMRGGVQ